MAVVVAGCADPAPTFSGDIEPLLARSCITSGCHGGPELQTGLDLSPGVAHDQLVGVPSAQAPALDRVVPGDPGASYLVSKLRNTAGEDGGGGDIMPPGFGLAANEIELVEAWITAGALDD